MLFSEVQVGQKFTLNGDTLEKIDLMPRTCCRAELNAKLPDGGLRFVEDNTEVQINEN